MHDRWNASAGINDDVLSDIEVDLEHALAALREFRRDEEDKRNAAWDAGNEWPNPWAKK
jgi:hypothetical protein